VHPRITADPTAKNESRHLCANWDASAPNLGRWPSVHFCEHCVEPAQAAEPCAYGDLRHLEIGLVEQALRSLHSRRLGDLNRACTEMSLEEPGQMARTDPQPVGKGVDTIVIEGTILDQAQCALDCCAGSLPGG